MLMPCVFLLSTALGGDRLQQDPKVDPTSGATQPSAELDGRLERGLIFGAVLDADGKPWVGAEVLFESWPRPGVDCGEGDLVRTKADDRGRFRAPAVRGWEYKVWAQQSLADGRLRTSNIVSDVQAGDPVDLREAHRGLAGISVAVSATEPWAELAPLSLEWEADVPQARTRVPLPESGALSIPAWVGSLEVRVIGANGQKIFTREVSPSLSQMPKQVEITLPAPVRHLLFVHKEASDEPIQQARLVAFDDRCVWPIGETDENGLLEVLFISEEWDAWGHRVQAPGRVWGFGEARDSVPEGKHAERAQKIVDAGGKYLTAGLCESHTVQGSIAIGDDTPLSGVAVVVMSEAHGQVDDGSYYGSSANWTVRSDANGAFAADQVYNGSSSEVWAFLPERVVAGLPASWQKGLRRRALVGLVDKKETDLGVVNLTRDLMPWDIQVETPEGLPAAGATVEVDTGSTDYRLPKVRADRAGRVRLLLPRSGAMGFIIRHDSGSLAMHGSMEENSNVVPEKVPLWRARLNIGMLIRGKVTDQNGNPVAGARIRVHPDYPFRLESDADNGFAMGPVTVTPEVGDERDHANWEFVSSSATADAEGNYEVRVPRGTGGLKFRVNGVGETLHVEGEDEYTLDLQVSAGG